MTLFRLPVILGALAFGSALYAAEPVQMNNSNTVWFENWIGLSQANMRVASPDGEIKDVFAARGTPVFTLSGGDVSDGVYRYELRASTDEKIKNRDYSKDSVLEGESEEYTVKQLYTTGSFVVERGIIVKRDDTEEVEGKE
jgi:hypothetical protein